MFRAQYRAPMKGENHVLRKVILFSVVCLFVVTLPTYASPTMLPGTCWFSCTCPEYGSFCSGGPGYWPTDPWGQCLATCETKYCFAHSDVQTMCENTREVYQNSGCTLTPDFEILEGMCDDLYMQYSDCAAACAHVGTCTNC